MFCKKCYSRGQNILDVVDLAATADKAAKAPTKTKKQIKFKVGDYVLAQYPGYGEKLYQCEIYCKYRGKYHLYYFDDSSCRKNVEEKEMQTPEEPWTDKTREDYLNHPFKRSGQPWHAIKIGKSRQANKYGCKPVGKESSKLVWIDVAQVQKLVTFQ